MIKKLADFHALPPRAKRLWVAAAWLLLVIRFAVAFVPFPMLRALIAKCHILQSLRRPVNPDLLDEIAWAVKSAARWVPVRGTCLVQALAGQILCACWGQSGTLCIGVAKNRRGAFEAHAWLVTSEGETIIGQVAGLKHFVPLHGLWKGNGSQEP